MVEMTLAKVEYVVDEIFGAFAASAATRFVLMESGNDISSNAGAVWTVDVLPAISLPS